MTSTSRHSVTRSKGAPLAGRSPRHAPVTAGSKHGKTEDPRADFSDEEWNDMVATAAYFRAEARGFEAGSAQDDWYEAEAELRERFSAADSEAVEAGGIPTGDGGRFETTGE
jgi:hypothetical protein